MITHAEHASGDRGTTTALFLGRRRRFFLVGAENVLLHFPQFDLVRANGIFHALLVLFEQRCTAVFLTSFQEVLRKPTVEARVVLLLELVAFVSDTVHRPKTYQSGTRGKKERYQTLASKQTDKCCVYRLTSEPHFCPSAASAAHVFGSYSVVGVVYHCITPPMGYG